MIMRRPIRYNLNADMKKVFKRLGKIWSANRKKNVVNVDRSLRILQFDFNRTEETSIAFDLRGPDEISS